MTFNPSQFPEANPTPAAPPARKGCGCIQFVIAGCALILAFIITIWVLVMHSPLPLRMLASVLTKSEPDPVIMTGIKGSASSGYRIAHIESGKNSFEDVRFHSSGIIRMLTRQELVISEIHVGKARITSDFSSSTSESNDSGESTTESDGGTGGEDSDFYFQMDRLSLNDIVIIDSATGFELSIPQLEWTGFKAGKGKFDLGDIHIDSNVLKLSSSQTAPSGWKIDATALPGIHKLLIEPLSVSAAIIHENGNITGEFQGFDGAVVIRLDADGSETTVIRGLDLTRWIDRPLPDDIQFEMTTREAGGRKLTEIRSGSFRLGTTTFTITPVSPNDTEAVATGTQGEVSFRITSLLDSDAEAPNDKPFLTSTPPMVPQDILAHIYHGTSDADLTPEQRERLTPALEWFRFAEN